MAPTRYLRLCERGLAKKNSMYIAGLIVKGKLSEIYVDIVRVHTTPLQVLHCCLLRSLMKQQIINTNSP
jgi:hypothetical protein